MKLNEFIETLQGAAVGLSQDLVDVYVNGFHVIGIDAKIHSVDIIVDDGEENYES